jgi:hypothetical protein
MGWSGVGKATDPAAPVVIGDQFAVTNPLSGRQKSYWQKQ